METLMECCAGLDVHQGSVVVALLCVKGRKVEKEIRTFGTMKADLEQLADWLCESECTDVAMEATGVYWLPVYAALEYRLNVTVANARHISKVPGRKTDVSDAEWIAQLLMHGLLKKSFIPPADLRCVRDIMRYRRGLVETRTTERNRVLKLLESASIKLASVASDVFGVSGMLMLKAMALGTKTPSEVAKLAKGVLKKKEDQLCLALDGRLQPHHRQLLTMQISRLQELEADIAELEAKANALLKPYQREMELLQSIPGVSWVGAGTIICELGVDMSVFPSSGHFASWIGLTPGNNQTGGKSRPAKVTLGNVYVKTALAECALSTSRAKGTHLRDKFYRVKARRGHQRAVIAVAHKMARIAYCILRDKTPYRELGDAYLDRRDEARIVSSQVRRLNRLGYKVTLERLTPVHTPCS